MELFQLVAKLGMDTSEYEKGVKESKSSITELSEHVSAKTIAMGQLIAHGVEKAMSVIQNLGKSVIAASVTVDEGNRQFTAMFGELESTAEGVFDKIADKTGVLKDRLKGPGTQAFAQFKAAGIDSVNALNAVGTHMTLAADAAAAFNLSLDEAESLMRSFVRGQTRAGAQIGLVVDESYRSERALQAYGKEYSKLTEAQKEMLMLNIAEEMYKTNDILGSSAKNADSWANVTANAKEAWTQFLAVIGKPFQDALTPVIVKAKEFFDDSTIRLRVGYVADKLGQIAGFVFDGAIGFLDTVLKWSNGEETEKFNIDFPTWEEVKTSATTAIDTIVAGVKGIATWTLGSFTVEGMSVEEITKKFKDWMDESSLYDKILGLLKWTLGDFVPPALETVESLIKTWWSITWSGIESIFKWTLSELTLPFLFGPNGVITIISNWWNNTVATPLYDATGWNLRLPELPSVQDMVDSISSWWEQVKAGVGALVLHVKTSVQENTYDSEHGGNGLTQEQADRIALGLDPGYAPRAVGIDYVPYNGYRAMLHEGESVLTKAEATEWRKGASTQGTLDVGAIASAVSVAVRDALNGVAVNIDGQRAGDLLTDSISRNIADGAYRMRYSV